MDEHTEDDKMRNGPRSAERLFLHSLPSPLPHCPSGFIKFSYYTPPSIAAGAPKK